MFEDLELNSTINPKVSARRTLARLTERDAELLTLTALHGAVTRDRLVDLGFFSSISRANRRLRMLFDGEYLRRAYIADNAHGAKVVYLLGREGVELVAAKTGQATSDLTRQARRTSSRMFLEHHLLALDLRLAIQGEAIRTGARIETYLTEPECRHEYEVVSSGRQERRIIKPDGFFAVSGESRFSAFLEADRGCVSSGQLSRTFHRYRWYLEEGAFADCYPGSSFEVLLVTTAGMRRVRNLIPLTSKIFEPVIRFTTYEDVCGKGFFGPIWHRSGHAKHGESLPFRGGDGR